MNDLSVTVYIVDDDDGSRQSLKALVRSIGVEAITFASAEEFLEAIDPDRPGCLVTDLRMLGMSGIELQEELLVRGIGLPVILLTAHAETPLTVQLGGGIRDQERVRYWLDNGVTRCVVGSFALAEPGEFTRRAFLNGRIDLTQAEAVIDILSARTRKGVDLALEQMSGALYKEVDRLRASLVEIRALLETAIDFPEEEIEIADHRSIAAKLQEEVLDRLKDLDEVAYLRFVSVYKEFQGAADFEKDLNESLAALFRG